MVEDLGVFGSCMFKRIVFCQGVFRQTKWWFDLRQAQDDSLTVTFCFSLSSQQLRWKTTNENRIGCYLSKFGSV
jgi:hypothetical protein